MSEKSKFKIAVIGIGGVGGFVGGRLAARFENSDEVEIGLLARGENRRAIEINGLKIVANDDEQIVRPKLLEIEEIRDADLIILCTKDYDLPETVGSFKNSIGAQTAILPLLNGADTAERIGEILPANEIWQGGIYVVARLKEPGVVRETGNVCRVFFGSETGDQEKMRRVEQILNDAGIETHLAEDIAGKIWEKFAFISTIAAATSYLDAGMRRILETDEHQKLLFDLIAEVKAVAAAKKIKLGENVPYETLDRLRAFPYEATSSMHDDFAAGKPAEIEALVGYVVREAEKLDVAVPNYKLLYAELRAKQNQTAEAGRKL